ncbi:MAG: hypothetical protein FJZ90_00745 [Chloroflexi bacterium]|nr:hypothetical protein [Chloroflexota bacterium]
MRVTQVSAFLENRPGRLLYLLNVLAEAKINLLAHNIVDASDFGIIHLLVDDADRAVKVIQDAGVTCATTTVLQVSVPDEPGAFVSQVLKPLADMGINIEYSYTYNAPCEGEARIVLKVDDLDAGEKALANA